MILEIWLFNLIPGKTINDFTAHDQRIRMQSNAMILRFKRRYLGTYAVHNSANYSYAQMTVIDMPTIEDARTLQEHGLPDSPNFVDIVMESDAYMTDVAAVSLENLVPSPNLTRAFALDKSLFRVNMFGLQPGKTLPDFAAFDRRVTGRYSEYMGVIDWFYTGLYRAEGLPGLECAEVDVVQAASVEEARARDAAYPAPPDLLEIYEECRSYMTPPPRNMTFWLKPVSLAPIAHQPIRLT